MKTATAKARKPKIQANCPKCGGSGHIPRYAGIANGVCFTCNGAGKVLVSAEAPKVRPLTPYQAEKIEHIKTGQFDGLRYGELSELRGVAHWHWPQCPNLLQIWRERGGEAAFMAAQAERLASHYC